jgi:hypothetical protein
MMATEDTRAMERAEPLYTNTSLQRPAFQAGWRAAEATAEKLREERDDFKQDGLILEAELQQAESHAATLGEALKRCGEKARDRPIRGADIEAIVDAALASESDSNTEGER